MKGRSWEVVLFVQLLSGTTIKPTSTTLETVDSMYYGMNSPKQVMENNPAVITKSGVFTTLHQNNAITLISHSN